MGAVIATIGAIALSFGLQHVSDMLSRIAAQKKGLSQDQLIARLKTVLNEISASNSKAYNSLMDKLSNLPEASRLISSRGMSRLQEKRKKLRSNLDEVESRVRDVDTINERVSSYAYLPDSYKNSEAGRMDLQKIEQSIRQIK